MDRVHSAQRARHGNEVTCHSVLSRTQGTSPQCQRRIPTTGRITKILAVAAIRNVRPHFCLPHLCTRSDQGKQNAVMHWVERALPKRKRDRTRSALLMGVGPPWSAGTSMKVLHGSWLACILLTSQWKELFAYSVEYGLPEAASMVRATDPHA